MEGRVIKSRLRYSDRSKIVWLWLMGDPATDIAQEIGVSLSTVYRWVRRWETKGTLAHKPFSDSCRPFSDSRKLFSNDYRPFTDSRRLFSDNCKLFADNREPFTESRRCSDIPWQSGGGVYYPYAPYDHQQLYSAQNSADTHNLNFCVNYNANLLSFYGKDIRNEYDSLPEASMHIIQSRMNLSLALAATIFTLLHTLEIPLAIGGMEATQHDQNGDLTLLMDLLDKVYTPHCLRIVVSEQESYGTTNSTLLEEHQLKFVLHTAVKLEHKANEQSESKPYISIVITPKNFNQVRNAFQQIIMKIEKVNLYSCVTYIMSRPPDSHLLPLLSLSYHSKILTRYFLVHTQTSTEAEQFLLAQRLRKEENVAALVQEESQNKSYWRVLIRQLLHPSGSPQVLTVNRWSRDTGLASTDNIFPEQMANFYGQKLIGVALDFIPFIDFKKTEGSLLVELKTCVDKFLLDVMANKLNFTYDIVMPADGQWGFIKEDGHFGGVSGDVEYGRANFSLDLSLTYDRARLLDYTVSYYVDAITFITAKSRPSPAWRKLLTPFRTSVWLCVLVSVGGGSLLYHVIYHAQATLTSSHLRSSHAFMHVLASFLSQSLYACQSIHAYLSLQAGRIFLGFWLLYTFLVTSYYKTSLTSTLAVPFAPSTIDTLQELLQSGLSFGMQAQKGAEYQLFATSEVPIYKKLFEGMTFHTTEENLRKVAGGNYAYMYFTNTLAVQVAMHNNDPKRKTDLHLATEEIFPVGLVWVLPKGSPYKRTFDLVIKRCLYAGLINKWLRDSLAHFVQRPREESSQDTTAGEQEDRVDKKATTEIAFTLNHLQGPFFLLFLGSGAGCAALLGELFLVRCL